MRSRYPPAGVPADYWLNLSLPWVTSSEGFEFYTEDLLQTRTDQNNSTGMVTLSPFIYLSFKSYSRETTVLTTDHSPFHRNMVSSRRCSALETTSLYSDPFALLHVWFATALESFRTATEWWIALNHSNVCNLATSTQEDGFTFFAGTQDHLWRRPRF